MVLKTDKLKVLSTRDADLKKLHDLKLPGFEKIKDPVMIDFLIENVSRPNLCQQVIETGVLSKVVSDENDDIVAAYGWKVLEILGRGKDGRVLKPKSIDVSPKPYSPKQIPETEEHL